MIKAKGTDERTARKGKSPKLTVLAGGRAGSAGAGTSHKDNVDPASLSSHKAVSRALARWPAKDRVSVALYHAARVAAEASNEAGDASATLALLLRALDEAWPDDLDGVYAAALTRARAERRGSQHRSNPAPTQIALLRELAVYFERRGRLDDAGARAAGEDAIVMLRLRRAELVLGRPDGDYAEIARRAGAACVRVARRADADAVKHARAILRTWGWSKARADSATKHL